MPNIKEPGLQEIKERLQKIKILFADQKEKIVILKTKVKELEQKTKKYYNHYE